MARGPCSQVITNSEYLFNLTILLVVNFIVPASWVYFNAKQEYFWSLCI